MVKNISSSVLGKLSQPQVARPERIIGNPDIPFGRNELKNMWESIRYKIRAQIDRHKLNGELVTPVSRRVLKKVKSEDTRQLGRTISTLIEEAIVAECAHRLIHVAEAGTDTEEALHVEATQAIEMTSHNTSDHSGVALMKNPLSLRQEVRRVLVDCCDQNDVDKIMNGFDSLTNKRG